MGLTIQGNTVTAQSKVTVYGNDCNAVQMYGNEVWKKQTDEWETLFSGTKVFNSSGSMYIYGLSPNDTVTVTADGGFVEYAENANYWHPASMTRQQLPASLSYYSYASIELSVGTNELNIVFKDSDLSFKGSVVKYVPAGINITEIRRKR